MFLPFLTPVDFDGGLMNWFLPPAAFDRVGHLQEALLSNRLNVAEELAALVAVPGREDGELHQVSIVTSGNHGDF